MQSSRDIPGQTASSAASKSSTGGSARGQGSAQTLRTIVARREYSVLHLRSATMQMLGCTHTDVPEDGGQREVLCAPEDRDAEVMDSEAVFARVHGGESTAQSLTQPN